MNPSHFQPNVERFAGFASLYNDVRPQPPQVICDILTQLAQVERPRLVVDLGSGTGLSTRIWAERADQIVGIEPSRDMRAQAEAQTTAKNTSTATHAVRCKCIRYVEGFSHDTGLPEVCADIVTCSQSLHWMEPTSTFAEAARVLRAGGVFAAYDNDWPPTCSAVAEIAYNDFITRNEALGEARGFYRGVKKMDKEGHLARMRASGHFSFTNEIVLHSVEPGDAARLVGIALSQGGIAALFKNGMSEEQIGVPEFRRAVERALGDRAVPFWFSYRMRVGIK